MTLEIMMTFYVTPSVWDCVRLTGILPLVAEGDWLYIQLNITKKAQCTLFFVVLTGFPKGHETKSKSSHNIDTINNVN